VVALLAAATAAKRRNKKSESTRPMSSQAPPTSKVAANIPAASNPATASPVSRRTMVNSRAKHPSEERNDTSRSGRKPRPVTWATSADTQKYSGV